MPPCLQKTVYHVLRLTSFSCLIMAANSSTAYAQYATNFFYRNPNTGFTYSQQVGVGRDSAYGGFSYSNGRQSFSAGSGYNGRNYFNGTSYSNRDYIYSQGAAYVPGYNYGSSFFLPNDFRSSTIVRRRVSGTNCPTAGLTGP